MKTNQERVQEAKGFLLSILKYFDGSAEIVEEDFMGVVFFNIETENPELIIGRSGVNLGAIQTLLNRFVLKNKEGEEEAGFYVADVGNYKSRSIKYNLEILSTQAESIISSGDTKVDLPPMDSYHRKIVHSVVTSNWPNLETFSEGEGEYRHIVLVKNEE